MSHPRKRSDSSSNSVERITSETERGIARIVVAGIHEGVWCIPTAVIGNARAGTLKGKAGIADDDWPATLDRSGSFSADAGLAITHRQFAGPSHRALPVGC